MIVVAIWVREVQMPLSLHMETLNSVSLCRSFLEIIIVRILRPNYNSSIYIAVLYVGGSDLL